MTAPSNPFYPITHDDGINITNSLNSLAGALKNRVIIADDFDTTKTYAVGDYVIYEGNLYRFTAAHATGVWNSGHVTKVNVGTELKSLKTAIDGKLSLTGGTVTGILSIHNSNSTTAPYLITRRDNVGLGDTADTYKSLAYMIMRDKNGVDVAYITTIYGPAKETRVRVLANNQTTGGLVSNYLDLGVYADGTNFVSVSDKEAWLTALGLSDSGWQTATNPSKFTGNVYYRRIGKTVEVRAIDIKLTSGLSASNGISIGNIIPAGYRPSSYVTFPIRYHNDLKNATGLLGTDGNVYVYSPDTVAITTNSTICFTATYFLTI